MILPEDIAHEPDKMKRRFQILSNFPRLAHGWLVNRHRYKWPKDLLLHRSH